MKILIISDINKDKKSTIPYGLNVGKYTQTRVEILQYIDPRMVHGHYSSVSDSQSISPGEKLSQEEMLKRERDMKARELDKILSKEASRLNFPLRYKTIIEIGETEKKLNEKLQNEKDDVLIVTSTHPSNTMFKDLKNLLEIVEDKDVPMIIVPGKSIFLKPAESVVVTNFSDENFESMRKIFRWIEPFDLSFEGIAIQLSERTDEQDSDILNWKKDVEKAAHEQFTGSAKVITSKNHLHSLKTYVGERNPDWLIVTKDRRTAIGNQLFDNGHTGEIIDDLAKPVFLY